VSNRKSQPRLQGNPAPGGPSFSPWPEWLDIPEDASPGDIFSYTQEIPVEGYFIRRGTRAGKYVHGYTRYIERHFIVPEFFKPKAPPPLPKGKAGPWMSLDTYLENKYSEWEYFEIQDPIYRKREGLDVIDPDTLFVWHKPLRDFSLRSMDAEEVAMVRVWILLYNSNKDEYFVFCRTRTLLDTPEWTRKSLEEAYKAHVSEGYFDEQLGRAYPSIYEDVEDWAENHTDYVEVREILAWTVFNFPRGGKDREKAPAKTYVEGRQEHPRRASTRARKKVRLYTR
jgi:hypothetical protein